MEKNPQSEHLKNILLKKKHDQHDHNKECEMRITHQRDYKLVKYSGYKTESEETAKEKPNVKDIIKWTGTFWEIQVKVKVKVNFILEEATKAKRESRCVALLFL